MIIIHVKRYISNWCRVFHLFSIINFQCRIKESILKKMCWKVTKKFFYNLEYLTIEMNLKRYHSKSCYDIIDFRLYLNRQWKAFILYYLEKSHHKVLAEHPLNGIPLIPIKSNVKKGIRSIRLKLRFHFKMQNISVVSHATQ